MLTQAKASPDITNYLTYILCSLPPSPNLSADEVHLVRSSAAITLKNIVRAKYRSVSSSNQSYIRQSILSCLGDPNSQIRSFAGNVITELVKAGGILSWPELFGELLSKAGNTSGNISASAQEGAMNALVKICEDNSKILDKDYNGQRPLDIMMPKLIQLTQSPIPKVRAAALESINTFIPQKPRALLAEIDILLERLFQLAHDPSGDVRRFICRAFVQLVEIRPDKVLPHLDGLVDYMISQQRNIDDPELALEAAEFWLAVGDNNDLVGNLGPYLTKIIPVLLESMVYGEDDIIRLEGERDNADEEDRAQDIKPQFAASKSNRALDNGTKSTNGVNGSGQEEVGNDSLDEGEIEEDEEDGDEDPEDEWNLRKCSAAALDTLSSKFHRVVFEITIPYLKDNLTHDDWPNREAAVLAVGAVADGCFEVVTPHLPGLVPYLISLLQDPEPVVRKITCWALGRYAKWAAYLPSQQDKELYFVPMMDSILKRMLDKNKGVQEAAASAFSNLEEQAKRELTPFCKPIIQQFVKCFEVYKDKNMYILYDCVQTLAEKVGPALANPDLMNLLMPAVIQRWNKVSDQSHEMYPLLECLSYIATALGDAFAPYAVPVYQRCVTIIRQVLGDYVRAANHEAVDQPDKDLLVTSLDLLSAVIQALETSKSTELVSRTEPNIFDLLVFCLEDPNNDVRQSSYALLGDVTIKIYPQLRPFLPKILPLLTNQLALEDLPDEEAHEAFGVINNTCWALGEIAMQQDKSLTPYAEQLYNRLVSIMEDPNILESVNENAAIALGRLGLDCSDVLAKHLSEFAKSFLSKMEPLDQTDEKNHALLGLNRAILKNPQGMEDCLLEYFQAIAVFNLETFPVKDLTETFQLVRQTHHCPYGRYPLILN